MPDSQPSSGPAPPPAANGNGDATEVDPLIQSALEEFHGGLARSTSLRVRPKFDFAYFRERLWDVVLAAIALVALSPLYLLAAVLTRYKSPGPLIFRQKRLGKHGVPFDILKFRSMRVDAEQYLRENVDLYKRYVANNFKLELWEDPRISPCGRFLRRSKLDELPQIWNVLRGDMSLVGPRPHAVGMKASARELSEIVAEYAHRHRVKPGITGWAQVHGLRGPVTSAACVRRRVRLDLEYVARSSLWLDLKILARSAPVLFGDYKSAR
jgi:lipopolysaccharide/colanic/teichoic acid biosynthesis glycosyltransferase